jgi:hypothetical protein
MKVLLETAYVTSCKRPTPKRLRCCLRLELVVRVSYFSQKLVAAILCFHWCMVHNVEIRTPGDLGFPLLDLVLCIPTLLTKCFRTLLFTGKPGMLVMFGLILRRLPGGSNDNLLGNDWAQYFSTMVERATLQCIGEEWSFILLRCLHLVNFNISLMLSWMCLERHKVK